MRGNPESVVETLFSALLPRSKTSKSVHDFAYDSVISDEGDHVIAAGRTKNCSSPMFLFVARQYLVK